MQLQLDLRDIKVDLRFSRHRPKQKVLLGVSFRIAVTSKDRDCWSFDINNRRTDG
jgi:hypothetical protein